MSSPTLIGNGAVIPKLIFLASQPRSGSTLLQKILGAHSQIATCSEPWLMMPPLTPLLQQRFENSGHNGEMSRQALQTFVQELPGGREPFYSALRQSYGSIYARWMEGREETVFLDKTPRYYQVLPELLKVFPDAQFILLIRNPLAVLVSHLNTWGRPIDGGLNRSQDDLLLAPKLLAKYMDERLENLHVVHYEKLLVNPESVLSSLIRSLGLEVEGGLLEYEAVSNAKWDFGDQGKLYSDKYIDKQNSESWRQKLNDPAVWRLCRDYLVYLGEETMTQLGYSFQDLSDTIGATKPSGFVRTMTFSLDAVLRPEAIARPRVAVSAWLKRRFFSWRLR